MDILAFLVNLKNRAINNRANEIAYAFTAGLNNLDKTAM